MNIHRAVAVVYPFYNFSYCWNSKSLLHSYNFINVFDLNPATVNDTRIVSRQYKQ